MALLLFVCVLFWGAHKSLAPRARTLLGVWGQATLSFFAVATLLFFFFCECPKFCDLAKQRRKSFGGVAEVGEDDVSLYFFWLCVFLLGFFFVLLRARSTAGYMKIRENGPVNCFSQDFWFLCFRSPPKGLLLRSAVEGQFWAHFDHAT